MAETLVVNASPLIFLAGASRLELLGANEAVVRVPRSVAEEVSRFGVTDPAARALRTYPGYASWMTSLCPPRSKPGIWGRASRP